MNNNNEFELIEDETSQFITFRIQNYEYGVDISSIKEIKGWMNVTALPNTPKYVLGVINLRGTVVPIFDLKCRFGLGHSEPTKSHVILIITVGTRLMGLLVDAVTEIITIKAFEIREVPSIQANDANEAASIFRGVVNYDKRMIVLLVADEIFDNAVDISHENITQNLDHHDA
jgi:purine-binding chemotaxis protein CheW